MTKKYNLARKENIEILPAILEMKNELVIKNENINITTKEAYFNAIYSMKKIF